VEQIGHDSFWGCVDLVSVTIEPGSRLASIGDQAFSRCGCLEFINLPPNLEELRAYVFDSCSISVLRLESLLRLSLIGKNAFMYNDSLRSILIPGSVVEIGCRAFLDCHSLSEVHFVLPSKLVSIGGEAFGRCTSLTEFWIVASVEEIVGDFLRGSAVPEVFVEANNPHFETLEGFLVNGGRTILYYFGRDCDVRIGADIETIGPHSFEDCQFLRSVQFEPGSKLTQIEVCAFKNCRSLERVQFGGPSPTFGAAAFRECEKLKEVVFESPSEHLPVESSAFFGCSLLYQTSV
jgi:hypothetical protein